jgi:hypothetical protein
MILEIIEVNVENVKKLMEELIENLTIKLKFGLKRIKEECKNYNLNGI